VRDEPRSSDVLIAPIAFPSNARDDAFAPLMDRNGSIIMLIYRNLQVEYFCAGGWTTFSRTGSSGKSRPHASRAWVRSRLPAFWRGGFWCEAGALRAIAFRRACGLASIVVLNVQ
jgi:hypothetical protein